MKEQIRATIRQHVDIYYAADSEGNDLALAHFDLRGVDDAVEAVVKLVESQPVDRVRAMAALLYSTDIHFSVPTGNCKSVLVKCNDSDFACECRNDNCDHIRAVKLYLAQRESEKC